jgi:ATPase family associated with various cellular activities (AAA)
MNDLRSYMSTGYFEDSLIIDDLEQHLKTVAKTFGRSFDPKKKSWPYELTPALSYPEGADSQSTTAMILSSIFAMREEWGKTPWRRAASGMIYFFDFPLTGRILDELKDSFGESKILEAISTLIAEWDSTDEYVTRSNTFGLDDPMSLGWALDLVRWLKDRGGASGATDFERLLKKILQKCLERAEKLVGEAAKPVESRLVGNSIMTPGEGRRVGDSSYILARFAAVLVSIIKDKFLCRLLKASDRTTLARSEEILLERFETRLHDHLSFSEIVDSRFDPTELAFCLEGMLLIRADTVAKTVFDRVMSVLRSVQEKGASWRSETPMVYRNNGDVLFTVSVEAVNAILASFALFDGRSRLQYSVASEHIDLIKRYWRWLKARKAIVRVAEDRLEGWHSEHVNDPNLVHLWETSQVTEFLVNYRDQLKRHVARTSLQLAACSYKLPARPWPIATIGDDETKTPKDRWELACETFEPVSCLGDQYKVYKSVGERFVEPRLAEHGKPNYSMLLYGPPGTGKTTLASSLSWALKYPLITITVSDFLADGHAAIEARAKDLFDMLKAQPRTVVLFDEIDQFMLDRDSEYFREQETLFQFLTPGMLTKLNDLRASESVLFVMATNYAERIDAAIKREGRIDQHLLLLPPDRERRKLFIGKLWKSGSIDPEAAAEKSVFLSYNDMKSVSAKFPVADATKQMSLTSPAANPDSYVARFYKKDGKTLISNMRRTPIVEFIAMIALEVDATGKRRGEPDWVKQIEDECRRRFQANPPPKLKEEIEKFIAVTR